MSKLLTRGKIERAIDDGAIADWKRRRYEAFDEEMTDDTDDAPYPCYFAVDAHQDGNMRYLFADSPTTEAGLVTAADGVATYLDRAPSIADVTSLVLFFEPSGGDHSFETYWDQFWRVLEYLHRHDPAPWPDSVPSDPSDPRWEFCYAGVPMFVVARAPCYDNRRSRYTLDGLEITVQPRWVFDGLGGDSDAGQQARDRIRDRLTDYDDVGPHPDIGTYSDPEVHEWEQYMLPDSNDECVESFPIIDWDAQT